MMTPPQKCAVDPSRNHCKLAMNGNSPGNALSAPTIRVSTERISPEADANASDKITKTLIPIIPKPLTRLNECESAILSFDSNPLITVSKNRESGFPLQSPQWSEWF